MKRIFFSLLFIAGALLCAASYVENEYQARARLYTKQAHEAFDEGEYEKAIELSRLADENAELSRAYIAKMLARAEANERIMRANTRIQWAESIGADVTFPMAFSAGRQELEIALASFAEENYEAARDAAQRALDALADIRDVTPLPKYYVVRPWAQVKDCYWNIAGRPYVYNNPWLWENLYQANKESMEDPANPNLIHPGMKMLIPSISGEFRDGVYSDGNSYDAFPQPLQR
jgi:tetratricopeptide (TPR) repeat protein